MELNSDLEAMSLESSLNPSESQQSAIDSLPEDNLNAPCPFKPACLAKSSNEKNSVDFTRVVWFPWTETDFHPGMKVHSGGDQDRVGEKWSEVVSKWKNSFMLVGGREVRVLGLRKGGSWRIKFRVLLKEVKTLPPERLRAGTWLIHPVTLDPLLGFCGERGLIYIWDITQSTMRSRIIGHGGPISSMCTYNTLPWIFASTSRDRSTRVYDLSLSQDSVGQEAHWPTLSTQVIATQTADQRDYGVLPAPNQPLLLPAGPTRFGPGLGGSVENEVIGIGRCVIILRGQSVGTGGHGASVLGAAFHPSLPLIATCGVDNCVKIWRLPDYHPHSHNGPSYFLRVEDHPLFSSTTIHESRVNSIQWVSQDVLISKSSGDRPSGTLILWRWLGLGRFFPGGTVEQRLVRPLEHDYKDSRSYVVLASFPLDESKPDVYQPSPCETYYEERSFSLLIGIANKRNQIQIWNLQQAACPPYPLRPKKPETFFQYWESSKEDEPRKGNDSAEDSHFSSDDLQGRPRKRKRRRHASSPTISEMASSESSSDQETDDSVNSAQPHGGWLVDAIDLSKISALEEEQWKHEIIENRSNLQAVAFSPFGAKYFVAAGKGGCMSIWERKEKPKE